jgi:hypothetical protein
MTNSIKTNKYQNFPHNVINTITPKILHFLGCPLQFKEFDREYCVIPQNNYVSLGSTGDYVGFAV